MEFLRKRAALPPAAHRKLLWVAKKNRKFLKIFFEEGTFLEISAASTCQIFFVVIFNFLIDILTVDACHIVWLPFLSRGFSHHFFSNYSFIFFSWSSKKQKGFVNFFMTAEIFKSIVADTSNHFFAFWKKHKKLQ